MGQFKWSKEIIALSNTKIYCEYLLNGKPPILLIHGFASSIYTFRSVIPLLEKHFSVVAIDLPGFGRSEKSTTFVYSFANYAQLIVECIDYFKLREVFIIGHSMGGQIALYTAKKIPTKVKKLILICSSGYLKSANKLLIGCSYLPLFPLFLQHYVQKKGVKKSLEDVVYNRALITEELISEFGRPLLEKNFYKSLIRLLRHREGDLTTQQLKDIKVPTLLIWGREDKVVPFEVGRRLMRDLPNAKLIAYEKTGHLVTEERPLELCQQILTHTY